MSDSANSVAEVIRSRRTICDFELQIPPEETVRKAIELATWAPNHKQTEPWRFAILGPKTVAQIVELNTKLVREQQGDKAAEAKRDRWRKIPGWIAASYRRSGDPLRDKENYAAVCCAIQNLLLALWDERIGTKWSTGPITRTVELDELLGIDAETEQIVGLIWYGFPATIPKSHRKPVEEVLRKLP